MGSVGAVWGEVGELRGSVFWLKFGFLDGYDIYFVLVG